MIGHAAVIIFLRTGALRPPLVSIGKSAAAAIIEMRQADAARRKTKPSFLFVNNRLEGNSLLTIIAVLDRLGLASEALRKAGPSKSGV